MKNFLLVLLSIIIFSSAVNASETDYRQIYMDLEPANFSYVHNMDPNQFYDNKKATWSPYPLFRLSSPLYFKTTIVESGYYLLTPTVHKGKDYMLFKQEGLVKYIIPVYKKEFVPQGFYETHIPKQKLKITQRMSKNFYAFIGKVFGSSQQKPTPQCYLEAEDLDNNFVSIIVYYGPHRYYTIFRTVRF